MAANGKTFIVLCSTAIGIIYAAGYSVTQPPKLDRTSISAMALDSNNASAVQTAKPPSDSLRGYSSTASPAPSVGGSGPATASPPLPPTAGSGGNTGNNLSPRMADPNIRPQTIKPSQPVHSVQPTAKPAPTGQPSAAPTPSPAVQSPASPSAPKSKYKDGTFSGSGTNRFGTVEVDVTIKSGKISTVEITRSATRYPERYIDSLPAAVIASQSAKIDTVSGATRSSEDFINAVTDALGKAEQA